jgi:[acyl-carrier-protein] S-malonyltransferase
MTKTAFLFPGQGSQSVGMCGDLAEHFPEVRQTFEQASDVLSLDLWQMVSEGPADSLNQTENTQPALLAAGIATWRAWQACGGAQPDFMAGHSLGEYTALVAAGRLGFADAVRLVAERGRLMQQAVPAGNGAMAAILGLDDAVLEQVCRDAAQDGVVSCANYNSPGQIVIAGDKQAVDRACQLATGAGARRAVPLAVSVPSHCALMKPAAEQLSVLLEKLEIAEAGIPVVQNVDVSIHATPDGIRRALVAQLWQPVRWAASVEALMGQGAGRFAECGPGKVLAGLNRRISRDIESAALVTRDSLVDSAQLWR